MRFATDQQTLEDLNIFGKHGGESVYALFNRTSTRGGALVLEELFRYPMSDERAINQRVCIIAYFAFRETVFPFDSESFDRAERYLAETDERTKLSGEDRTLGTRLTSIIGADNEYKAIEGGVAALLAILHTLRDFLLSVNVERATDGATGASAYGDELDAMTRLLATGALETILHESVKNKLSYNQVRAFDILLRFSQRETIRKLLRHIYYLDVCITVARVAFQRGFAFPRALPAGKQEVLLEGVYHPQLAKPVPNSLRITPDGNVLFLTGANMAGKSTFMKTLGIAMFLAHMGFPVPAERMEFSVLEGIYTTINLPDDLGMGASHFYAEVLRIKKIAGELGRSRHILVIFDELFRGTNVKDAYEATVALTTAFAGRRDSIFVISTHIIEAGDVLKERCNNISFVYLPTRMQGHTPVYTYTLEQGITADRHGMVIINNEGIIDILKRGRLKLQTP